MSRTTIRLIVVLMSAALLGLVGFQIYWVSNAQRINKARFKQDVHEALNLVAQKLEKQETLLIAQNNFKSKFRWSDPLDLNSDTIEFFESSFQKRVVNRSDLDNDSVSIPNQTVLSYQFEANDGFEIIAFSERETPNDVLVSHQPCKLENTSMVIGTSSTRRVAILKRHFPKVKTVPVRGNLQTRIRKMEEGACDALLLAYAGVHRMQREDLIREVLDPGLFIPAVGQGSVAIECATSLDKGLKEKVKNAVNHPDTALCVEAERAFLRKLQGGCSIPAFALAHLEQNQVVIEGGVVSLDGQKMVREKFSDNPSQHIALGVKLATVILDGGGDKILEEIRHSTE